jgi:hypothetical protein
VLVGWFSGYRKSTFDDQLINLKITKVKTGKGVSDLEYLLAFIIS